MSTINASLSELTQLKDVLQSMQTALSDRHMALLYDILRHKETGKQESAEARQYIADNLVAVKDHLTLAQEGISSILFPSEAHRWLDRLLNAPNCQAREAVVDSIRASFQPEKSHTVETVANTQYWGIFADGSLLDFWIYQDSAGDLYLDVKDCIVATAAEMQR